MAQAYDLCVGWRKYGNIDNTEQLTGLMMNSETATFDGSKISSGCHDSDVDETQKLLITSMVKGLMANT